MKQNKMTRGKLQAVYSFLPGVWISDYSGNQVVTAQIKNWNNIKMDGLYSTFIENEIKRQIKLFGERGGDISSFNLDNSVSTFEIVEPACNEGIPDIIGELSPLVFYCSHCHRVFTAPSAVKGQSFRGTCNSCKIGTIKQLQMIYACECGYAQGIETPYAKGVKQYLYYPNEDSFKMKYDVGMNRKAIQLTKKCPNCDSQLLPKNAVAGANYKPFTLRLINLIDQRAGKFYDKGIDAQKIIVAKWFNQLPQDEFEKILNSVDYYFSPEYQAQVSQNNINEKDIQALMDGQGFDRKTAEAVLRTLSNSSKIESPIVHSIKYFDDELFSNKKDTESPEFKDWLDNFAFKLMQYETIKYAKRIITLEESINRQIELEFIDTKEEIDELNSRLGISNMQVSYDIEIINCTYGFTRLSVDPLNSQNKSIPLKLNAYDKAKDGFRNLAYGSKLETEGILFEIDQVKIIKWLHKNGIVPEEKLPDYDDELAVKKWFVENVRGDVISMFGEVAESELITKYVFALLHSMSHAFLKTAGEMSGLSSNSLTEIVIVDTASIFIYSQTGQGIPLGALSGMAETQYKYFLQKTLEDNRNCLFDPLCNDHTSSCMACLILPEISCNHFNSELGRKYLYSLSGENNLTVGFWDMDDEEE